MNVVPGNPPIARNDNYAVSEDETGSTLLGSVLTNDAYTTPGGMLSVATYQSVTPLQAFVLMNMDGTFRYNATGAERLQGLDVGETLTDTFTYRASDGTFLSSAATVTITVQGRNDPPQAFDDTQVFTDQNRIIEIDVVANDIDPEQHPLTVSLFSLTTSLGAKVQVDAARNVVIYDPSGKFNHLNIDDSVTDTFTYQVSDGRGGTDTATVLVKVSGLNDPPVAVTDVSPVARRRTKVPRSSFPCWPTTAIPRARR